MCDTGLVGLTPVCWHAGALLRALLLQEDPVAIKACAPARRGLALLGRTEMPQFRALLAALTGAHARRTLEPRLQRQLHQAVQHAHAAGTVGADALPPELARSAAKWWSKAAVTVPSLSLQRVARLVRMHDAPAHEDKRFKGVALGPRALPWVPACGRAAGASAQRVLKAWCAGLGR